MLKIKTPATSANVGPGFDCFGLALNIFNTFEVELSEETKLENVEDRFNNEDNLFLQAYRRGCTAIGVKDNIHAIFDCDIPVSRGLGSSASLIVGGLLAASALHNNAIDADQLLHLAGLMEGHPDNVAPCIYGGMTASITHENTFITHKLDISDKWKYAVLIPDFEVSTEKARAILPESYPREIAALNASHAALMIEALRTANGALLKIASEDFIHEPYRKKLIDEFDELEKITEPIGKLLVSGSGSTCLLIYRGSISDIMKQQISSLKHNWKLIETSICEKGAEVVR